MNAFPNVALGVTANRTAAYWCASRAMRGLDSGDGMQLTGAQITAYLRQAAKGPGAKLRICALTELERRDRAIAGQAGTDGGVA